MDGDAYVRVNATSTSNVQAATQFKLGGTIGDDTKYINEGASALNIVGKRYVPARGQPFEVGGDTLRTVNVYDNLDTPDIGLIRTASRLKVGGFFNDDSAAINARTLTMSIVGKGGWPF